MKIYSITLIIALSMMSCSVKKPIIKEITDTKIIELKDSTLLLETSILVDNPNPFAITFIKRRQNYKTTFKFIKPTL